MMSRHRYTELVRKVPPDLVLAVADIWIGVAFALQGPERTPKTGIYMIARDLMSMRVWGALFFIIGLAVLYIAALNHRGSWADDGLARTAAAWVQVGGPALFAAWATMALLSAMLSGGASFSAAALYAFLAYRHTFVPDMPSSDGRDSGKSWSSMD